ncbi:MAG TPA: PLP-dependent aminotransferase family protein [Polyangia bacterium]
MPTAPASIDQMIRTAAASPRVIGLGGGLPAEAQFPREALAASFLRVLQRQGSPALQYGWPEGQEPLRMWVAQRLQRRGATVDPDDVIITNGAQQAIAIASGLALRKGDVIGVEAESYPAALDLFRSRGLRLGSLRHGRASYVMPGISNPRGRPMPDDQRAALLAQSGAIIEDEAYADLDFAGHTVEPLLVAAPERTYHVGTISKTLCPGLRVGWLVVPRARRERALEIKQTVDLQSNSLAQAIVEDYLSHVDFEARLRVLRRFYRKRASQLAEAVRKALPSWSFSFPEGGFSLWLTTDATVDEKRFFERAIAEGVSFDLGSSFVRRRLPGPTQVRLCFSAEKPGKFVEGARRLARAWRWAVKSARR